MPLWPLPAVGPNSVSQDGGRCGSRAGETVKRENLRVSMRLDSACLADGSKAGVMGTSEERTGCDWAVLGSDTMET